MAEHYEIDEWDNIPNSSGSSLTLRAQNANRVVSLMLMSTLIATGVGFTIGAVLFFVLVNAVDLELGIGIPMWLYSTLCAPASYRFLRDTGLFGLLDRGSDDDDWKGVILFIIFLLTVIIAPIYTITKTVLLIRDKVRCKRVINAEKRGMDKDEIEIAYLENLEKVEKRHNLR